MYPKSLTLLLPLVVLVSVVPMVDRVREIRVTEIRVRVMRVTGIRVRVIRVKIRC